MSLPSSSIYIPSSTNGRGKCETVAELIANRTFPSLRDWAPFLHRDPFCGRCVLANVLLPLDSCCVLFTLGTTTARLYLSIDFFIIGVLCSCQLHFEMEFNFN